MRELGMRVERLDGDDIRQDLSNDLGFTRRDREINIRRVGFVAKLLTRNGVAVIAALISPYRQARDLNRSEIGNFVEIYCRCPLEVAERRDVKGLYKKARRAKSNHSRESTTRMSRQLTLKSLLTLTKRPSMNRLKRSGPPSS
jgi:adenylyl-sulfate kinase